MRDIILGGQDGLVNVLGIVLGVAGATSDTVTVLIAGIAATFAESISMAAVAYTSMKASLDYYYSERAREKREIEERPEEERREIKEIYFKKGFRGTLLNNIVRHITKDKDVWLKTMMSEELDLSLKEISNPLGSGITVGVSAIIGSIVPLIPFFFLSVGHAMVGSLLISTITLYATGYVKAKLTIGDPIKSGVELAVIGMLAALTGYGIGILLGWIFGTTIIV